MPRPLSRLPAHAAMPQLFGEKLRALRRQYALTQTVLAQRAGLASHTHIAKLEAGQDTPSLELVIRLATILNVSTDYLLRDALCVKQQQASLDSSDQDVALHLFGAKLRILRLQHGLSQGDLAQQLGLARRGYISNLETGRKLPSLELVVLIADLFGVTTDYLLAGTLHPNLAANN
jgi:transcriptional regulator with XRE-family HTH domain